MDVYFHNGLYFAQGNGINFCRFLTLLVTSRIINNVDVFQNTKSMMVIFGFCVLRLYMVKSQYMKIRAPRSLLVYVGIYFFLNEKKK